MRTLDNPEDNPCFGCGPANDRGLSLSFARDEDDNGRPFVTALHEPGEDEIGWPGFFHGGLHFTLLYETSYWTALTLGPAMMTADSQLVFDERTVPRVGKPVRTRGFLEGETDDRYRVRAVSLGADGRHLGTLEGRWRPARREEIERAGIELPDYLMEGLAD